MTTEVQWSELQRDPKSVAALADQGDVRVKRRDGAPLLLTREDRAAFANEGAVTAARVLGDILAHLPENVAAEALKHNFPWTDLLPEDARAQFAVDFVRAFQTSAELGDWSVVAEAVYGWRSTAAVYRDPELVRKLTEPIDAEFDYGPVPNPMET